MSKEYDRMRLVMLLVFVAACSTKPNPKSCLDDHCSDPELPFCDVTGSVGGAPNTCIAVECTANQFEECRDDRALTCNAAGDNYDLVECEFGCGSGGCLPCNTSECEKHIVPKYLPSVCNQPAGLPMLTISANTNFDTSVDEACSSVVVQTNAPEICVLRYGTIKVDVGQTYTVTGSRALALVADGDVTIDGVLDVSASFQLSGPGGGFQKSGSGQTSAGGGAGHRHAGGAGGNLTTAGGANNGGAASVNPMQLSTLSGGPSATRGTDGSPPGGGGGGVSLISCRGEVLVRGTIDAGGGGGFGDSFTNQPAYIYAAGGGAGGTVVLQGMNVNVIGSVFANGGGGGGGGGPGSLGSDGLRSTTAALGGGANVNGGGIGGRGGTANPPGLGGAASEGAAGGGGSAGFLLAFTPENVFPVLGSSSSPPFDPKGTIATN